ncbi:hypothetical protein MHC_01720 [Mycoplasma haemocanis str. Illinois]|uniref:Uncharacterized protein n=1 Tax=Mycoplasma haemocanis (strain Illinois) TaxID=1111676 RepID=H6N6D8_MYCHN|nr:hypothetical protein [Mycoplasma haemocanis]AEW45210.1 hypothetical protein MHC_01720 [Mycoplasma haemocanis str. Illinois]
MEFPFIAKSLTGLLALGVTGASAVYFGYFYGNKGTRISELLKSANPEKRFISAEASDQKWKDAWKKYREDHKNENKDPLSLSDWSKPNGEIRNDQNAPQSFLNACSSLKEEHVKGVKSYRYELASKYCTRDTIVRDLIEEEGKRTLLEKTGSSGTSDAWKAAWKTYLDDNKSESSNLWSLNNWTTIKSQIEAPESFMTQCETKSKESLESVKYSEVYKYCTELKKN